ncbi:Receptor-like kinase [Quillaja saponaria]|uniref:Receptor-like kinase n=1 Tax=Quillaja saponaria TaxID=32244 RepID=A0AAD7VNM0_QUISA|nr:Receptor-like kinase [Quillaja saponaria]
MNHILETILVLVAIFFMVAIISAIFIACRKSKKPSNQMLPQTTIKKPKRKSTAVDDSLSYDQYFKMSIAELAVATKNFSQDLIIGQGRSGTVYKARLSNGLVIAVKKLHPNVFQGLRKFRAEMETLGKLRHRNIVKLIGYCESGSDRVLVYKFMEEGNLQQWLHQNKNGNVSSSSSRLLLSWEVRNNIIHGVAKGLSYLHGLEKPIVHRNINAGNVLLNSEFEGHISDFGLARRIQISRSHTSTDVDGTMGYLPPECREGAAVVTIMGDVYSFGVLMLETAMGERPDLWLAVNGKKEGMVEWVRERVARNAEMQMVDPSISRDTLRDASVKVYFKVACMCTKDLPRERPTMTEVNGLHKTRQLLPQQLQAFLSCPACVVLDVHQYH